MLREIQEGLWTVDHPQVLPGGFALPTRMTIVRLPSGGLWIHSPIPLDDTDTKAIAELGNVEHVVAPNLFHNIYCAEARSRWPNAKHWAPEGMADKRPELQFDAVIEGQPWADTFDRIFIEGAPTVNESVFFHRASGTLIFPDLMFNVREPQGFVTSLIMRMVGAHKRLAQSRSWRWVFVKDRSAHGRSVRGVLEVPATRLIPCHGEILEGSEASVRSELEDALAWSLAHAPQPLAASA